MDIDVFAETLELSSATWNFSEKDDPNTDAHNITLMMSDAADIATSRIKHPERRKQAYWWSPALHELREDCIRARRVWTKIKKKKRNRRIEEELKEAEKNYKLKRKIFTNAIHKAKEEAWNLLIAEIDKNQWGLPYKLVMGRMRSSTMGLTATLDANTLDKVISGLFPKDEVHVSAPASLQWKEEWNVTPLEIFRVVNKNRSSNNVAPGPDGISCVAWKRIPDSFRNIVAELMTKCLKSDIFPDRWKVAKLVLIPKGQESENGIPRVRPICLLDELGKTLERVIMLRIQEWLRHNEGKLSANQFGFRPNHSTIDALKKVTRTIEEESAGDGVVVGISLDIKNAFNSLPWSKIKYTLLMKKFPRYIRRIMSNYLSNRYIEYMTEDGTIHREQVFMGVPQGSIVGPFLWNITYDKILRVDKLPDTEVICYVDDTIVIASADNYEAAKTKAVIMVVRVLERITQLGLEVALQKTQVVAFYRKKKKAPPSDAFIRINGVDVAVKSEMKYLGIILDSKLIHTYILIHYI